MVLRILCSYVRYSLKVLQQTSGWGKCRSLGAAVRGWEAACLVATAELAADRLAIICLPLLVAGKGGVSVSFCSIEKQTRIQGRFKK